MAIQITIDTGNAAFEDNGSGNEVASILEDLAAHFRGIGTGPAEDISGKHLYDSNGNEVGRAWAR